jgi:glycosyltransferase involved in cell wall biosynthesis
MLLRHKPDLVYLPIAQGTLGYLRDCLFLVPSRLFGLPTVVHLHGSEFKAFYRSKGSIMKALIRYTLRNVQRVIVLDTTLVHVFDDILPDWKVEVIPNGIEPLCLSDGCGKEPTDKDSVTVTYLGTLKQRKGFLELLYSIPRILELAPQAKFIFAGECTDPVADSQAKNFIEENRLKDCVEFVGPVFGQDKAELLSSSDIFCFPPIRAEGQPLVILEAMSCGLPVISSNLGAIPSLISDGETGYLVGPQDRNSLTDKVVELIQNPTKRIKMGRKGRERFENKFTIDRWEKQLSNLFHEVLQPNEVG